MTGAAYRWTASLGVFLGVVATLLIASAFLPIRFPDERLASIMFCLASLFGIGISLFSIFLHPDHPDRESPLNHRAVGFLAVALNCWPWVLFVWLIWFGPFWI